MTYRLPSFPETASIWLPGNTPAAGPPDFTGAPIQLYWPSKVNPVSDEVGGPSYTVPTIIRLDPTWYLANLNGGGPYVGAIFGWANPFFNAGDTFYYLVQWWDVEHCGFPNQYPGFVVLQCTTIGSVPDLAR